MVALQAAATATTAVIIHEASRRFPLPTANPKWDAGTKALAGLALIIASRWVSQGWMKAVLIGAGVGLITGGLTPWMPLPEGR